MKRFWAGLLLPAAAAAVAAAPGGAPYAGEKDEDQVVLKSPAGGHILRYVRRALPPGEKAPAVEGACYTHPLRTPSGPIVSDLGPADHPHHRGLFCAWVAVEGEKRGDWWGWGAKAPKEGRAVVNREARVETSAEQVRLRLVNQWRAEGAAVLEERLAIRARQLSAAYVLDYVYEFRAPTRKPVVLEQNPFGGFCYRALPRGVLTVSGPEGKVERPDAVHNRAETNWPASRWYDMSYLTPENRTNGVTVMDHPANPPSTWHVVKSIHMLNPCIVAGGPVTIAPGRPLTLRYRVVVHDGDPASAALPGHWAEFAGTSG